MSEPEDDTPVLLEIGEAAHVLTVSTTMVRRYTEQGLLKPAARTRRGVRLYEEAEVAALARRKGREPRKLQ